jgi:hypothetical protein
MVKSDLQDDMKTVRVQYQVRTEYVDQNKANIQAVMKDLKDNPIDGMLYAAYYLGDGNFMHVNSMVNPEAGSALNARESFTHFRTSLKASQPVQPPQSVDIELVGVNLDL